MVDDRKKRRRRKKAKKVVKSIAGMDKEEINRRINQTPEERLAQREKIAREIKEKRKQLRNKANKKKR